MALYFKDIEITNIDNLVPQSGLDITDIWFGSANVYTIWETYEGTLPATINANGDNMRQYQIWGNVGGVGDRTVQLFDKKATDTNNGYEQGYYLCPPNISGGKWANSSYAISEYIDIEGLPSITFSGYTSYYSLGIENEFYNASKQRLLAFETTTIPATINVPTSAKYVRFSIRLNRATKIMLTEGSTPPASYVPYGYGLSLSVTSPKSYTCEVNSLQASTNYAKIAVAELPTVKVGDKVTVTVGGTDYTLPVKNVDSSYVYIENMEV